MVCDLKSTTEGDGAAIGWFIALTEPTREMELDASTAGFYHAPISGKDYPKIHILCIRDLLDEYGEPMLPLHLPTCQQAQRIPTKKAAEQQEMFG